VECSHHRADGARHAKRQVLQELSLLARDINPVDLGEDVANLQPRLDVSRRRRHAQRGQARPRTAPQLTSTRWSGASRGPFPSRPQLGAKVASQGRGGGQERANLSARSTYLDAANLGRHARDHIIHDHAPSALVACVPRLHMQ